ncbi:MAG: VOC family protein [Bacillota bacterium]|nr:VOC family protein [Bacillota bacterium]
MKMVHVTVQTACFEEEIGFYQEHAGLKIVRDMRSAGRNMVFLANGDGETNIEIIENKEADNSGNPNLSVGFCTEDVDKKREKLIECGFDVTPIIAPAPDVKFFFVTDPAGVKVQFIN